MESLLSKLLMAVLAVGLGCGGVMTLFRSKTDPNAYSGQWQQQGSQGGANLNFSEPFTKATGSWNSAGSSAQSAMTVTPCG